MMQFRTLASSRTEVEFNNRWKATQKEWCDKYAVFVMDFFGKHGHRNTNWCSSSVTKMPSSAIGSKRGHCTVVLDCPGRSSIKFVPI